MSYMRSIERPFDRGYTMGASIDTSGRSRRRTTGTRGRRGHLRLVQEWECASDVMAEMALVSHPARAVPRGTTRAATRTRAVVQPRPTDERRPVRGRRPVRRPVTGGQPVTGGRRPQRSSARRKKCAPIRLTRRGRAVLFTVVLLVANALLGVGSTAERSAGSSSHPVAPEVSAAYPALTVPHPWEDYHPLQSARYAPAEVPLLGL